MMSTLRDKLTTHGLELVDRDRDGLLRVRYTSENPNRGFFRQFDTEQDVAVWLSEYGRPGTWEPEWDYAEP